MKRLLPAVLFFLPGVFSGITGSLKAQPVQVNRDPAITQMVSEISHEHLQELVKKLASFGTRHTLSDTGSDAWGIGAARRWIKSEFDRYSRESGGRLQVEYDSYLQKADNRRVFRDTEIKNVLAILPGSDPDDKRVFIVSGHYDSRASDVNDAEIDAPGANDDGSGTAAVMEMARVMSKQEFSATIIFACVAGEEQGLLGSGHLAERAKEEGWKVAGMISNDIVGNSQGSGTQLRNNTEVRVFSEGIPVGADEKEIELIRQLGAENDSPSRQFARYIKEVGERYVDQLEVKLIYRPDRFLRGGDHLPFSREGFTAVRITEMNEHFGHQHQDVRLENGQQYGDLPEFVDFEYLRKITGMNLASLANLASSPGQPQKVNILIEGLSNETTLSWEAPAGSGGSASAGSGSAEAAPAAVGTAGYYILIRETSSPVWEKKIRVTGTNANIPYSKDNYFFAVQAVDEQGHESLPVFPEPLRPEQ